jgi:hypothetical protein
MCSSAAANYCITIATSLNYQLTIVRIARVLILHIHLHVLRGLSALLCCLAQRCKEGEEKVRKGRKEKEKE